MLTGNYKTLADNLKKNLNSCYKFCITMDNNGLSKALGCSMKEQCRTDMIITSLYFSMADGVVRDAEAELLNHLFDTHLPASEYQRIYENANIDRAAFFSRKIMTLEIAKILDDTFNLGNCVGIFINLFVNTAKAIISIDGDADNEELASIATFQANLERKFL